MSANDNFRVVVRIRPPLDRELNNERGYKQIVDVNCKEEGRNYGTSVSITERWEGDGGIRSNLRSQQYTFDLVFDQASTQEEVYTKSGSPVVQSVMEGYNATMLAYGQTGTGKTYTMDGEPSDGSQKGIIPRAAEEIFAVIQQQQQPEVVGTGTRTEWMVKASYAQIYNEQLSDLIGKARGEEKKLTIRQEAHKGVYVEGLSQYRVNSPSDIFHLMAYGGEQRASGKTKMSEVSSRSHAIFSITCEKSEVAYEGGREVGRQLLRGGKLQIVDLAGSEKVRQTGATGQRLVESRKINGSLSALGNVLKNLTESSTFIPYRDTKLTRLLEDSLGGNCKTTMIANISPASEAYHESKSTLDFANRAKNIKNEAYVIEPQNQGMVLAQHQAEIKSLKKALEVAAKFIHDAKQGMTAGTLMPCPEGAMEPSSEIDRHTSEADKEQVDRYKQLLLKQRDVMIALTGRLNERDEFILSLETDIQSYETEYGMMQQEIDKQNAEIIRLRHENKQLKQRAGVTA